MKPRPRIKSKPEHHFFLFGPRGTGKTTWLKQIFPDAIWIDLLDRPLNRRLQSHPEQLKDLIDAQPNASVVVIDEVQRIPDLLLVVHQMMESGASPQFVLTGSSARKLRREGVDLLGGRATLRKMPPFLASELDEEFSLVKALQLGMLPVVWGSPTPQETLDGYIDVYIDQEVKIEALVRNIDGFSRLLEALSFSQAAMLNLSNIARECEVKRPTVEIHLSIIEDLLLGHLLPVFTKRSARALVSHPKFYYFDCGVYRTLRPIGPLDRSSETDGVALETLVYQHLMAWGTETKADVYYWRTKSGVEVDFVVYGQDTFIAFEVKNASRVRPEDIRGLKTFKEDYPEASAVLLYRGTERLLIDGILCVPVEKFLPTVIPGQILRL